MSGTLPVQAFQIGQRVEADNGDTFVITRIVLGAKAQLRYAGDDRIYYFGSDLTLPGNSLPDRPAIERRRREAVEPARKVWP